jgi:hypothetical protein
MKFQRAEEYITTTFEISFDRNICINITMWFRQMVENKSLPLVVGVHNFTVS